MTSISHIRNLLLTTDEASRATVLVLPSSRVVARLSLNFHVRASALSPCGLFAAFVGEKTEVWKLPEGTVPQFGAWNRVASFASSARTITWSPDSKRIAVGGTAVVTVYTLSTRQQGVHVKPLILHGHREAVISIHFVGLRGLLTLSHDGILFCWRLRYNDAEKNYGKSKYAYADEPGHNPKRKYYEVPVSAKLISRHYVKQGGARSARCSSICSPFLVVGMSNGVFALYELPDDMVSESEALDIGLFEIGEIRKRKRRAEKATKDDRRVAPALSNAMEREGQQVDEKIPVMPFTELSLLHSLSASAGAIKHITFNSIGDWIALSSSGGQILVWDWRAETHVLKQQAHLLSATSVAFSPDGRVVATGSKEGRIKLWSVATGFCAATFSEHQSSVSAIRFASNDVIVSASFDGTVRAFDIRRYRNFRVMVGPPPIRQFGCVAVDAAGELVAAGCVDSFEIVVWSIRTGQVVELLNGHQGPVRGLSFRPRRGTLASSSWDRTVRLWDMYERKGSCEILEHSKEVLDVIFRPDGKEFAACTASGEIVLWDAEKGAVVGTIDGARDAAPGRLRDSRTVAPQKGHFQTLSYSADGRFLFAGAASKYVCLYNLPEGSNPTLVSRVAVTQNQNFDGLLDRLNSKNLTVSGHAITTLDDDDEAAEEYADQKIANGRSLPGADAEEKLRRKRLMKAEVFCVNTCATGRLWAAVSSEGVLVYGEGEDDEQGGFLFDPRNLEIDITPKAIWKAASHGNHVTALSAALRLNDQDCLNFVVERVPLENVHLVIAAVPILFFSRLVYLFAWRLDNTPHLEFNLMWAKKLMIAQGAKAHNVASDPSTVNAALRALNRACLEHSRRIMPIADNNQHMLNYLKTVSAQGD